MKPWFVQFTTLSPKTNKAKWGWQRRGEEYEAKFCVAEWRKSVNANCRCVTRFALKNYFTLLNDLSWTEFEILYICLKFENRFLYLLSIINVILYNLLILWLCCLELCNCTYFVYNKNTFCYHKFSRSFTCLRSLHGIASPLWAKIRIGYAEMHALFHHICLFCLQ